LQGASDHLVSEAIYLADPEGNGVEVYRDRPREEWRWQGRQVVMATDPLDLQALLQTAGTGWAGAPAGTSVGHVHLRVGDVAKARDFYTGTLGFDVTRGMAHAVFLSTGGYHHQLAANVWQSAGAGPRDPGMAGLDRVVLRAGDERVLARIGRTELADPWGTTFIVSA
jgi:catechol 2,3-dioxygenase